MTSEEIDRKVREFYLELTEKIKGYKAGNLDDVNGDVVNKCLDYYFKLKAENMQLELF